MLVNVVTLADRLRPRCWITVDVIVAGVEIHRFECGHGFLHRTACMTVIFRQAFGGSAVKVNGREDQAAGFHGWLVVLAGCGCRDWRTL